jgi:hypothetical protein
LETVREDAVASRHPEWLHAWEEANDPETVSLGFFAQSSARSIRLLHKALPAVVCDWNAGDDATARCLLPDGTVVVTQANGEVCVLKLHYGKRRVSLAEAKAITIP